jgi:hypothetical protein
MTVQHLITGTGADYPRPLRFFTSLGRPLERYLAEILKIRAKTAEVGGTPEVERWKEAEERLAQLDFLICRITELQEHYRKYRASSYIL